MQSSQHRRRSDRLHRQQSPPCQHEDADHLIENCVGFLSLALGDDFEGLRFSEPVFAARTPTSQGGFPRSGENSGSAQFFVGYQRANEIADLCRPLVPQPFGELEIADPRLLVPEATGGKLVSFDLDELQHQPAFLFSTFGCGSEAAAMTLRLVRDPEQWGDAADHELALNVHQQRRFLGMPDDEPTELTSFCQGRINVAHALTAESHCRLLRAAERSREFTAAYQLVNGPLDRRLLARYRSDEIHRAHNGRASDKDIESRRALFIDIDPDRPKGISSTDAEQREAYEVSARIEQWLLGSVPQSAIARGCSGNGYFLLVALEPAAPTPESAQRISAFLELLSRKFGTERVKIDRSVFNAARLMPAGGTWKRKGENTPDRPHRKVTFSCRAEVTRVPLEEVC